MKAGDVVLVEGNSTLYYVKTPEEIRARQAEDEACGRFFDDGGEPLLYSNIGYFNTASPTVAMVVRARGAPWPHWTRRPKGLVECYVTVGGVPRVMMVKKSDLRPQGDVPSAP